MIYTWEFPYDKDLTYVHCLVIAKNKEWLLWQNLVAIFELIWLKNKKQLGAIYLSRTIFFNNANVL